MVEKDKKKTAFSIDVRFIVKVDSDDELKTYHQLVSKLVDENPHMGIQTYNVNLLGKEPEEDEE